MKSFPRTRESSGLDACFRRHDKHTQEKNLPSFIFNTLGKALENKGS